MRLNQLTEVDVEDLEQSVQGLLRRYQELFGGTMLMEDEAMLMHKAVEILKQRLLNTEDTTYQGIDSIMRDLSLTLEVDVNLLHDAFVDAEGITPDEWVISQQSESEDDRSL